MQHFLIIALAILVFATTGYFIKEKSVSQPQQTVVVEQSETVSEKVSVTPSSRTLDLSGKGLTKAPEYIFSRTDLEELDLSHNALTGALPAEVRRLSELKVLDLSNNNFTGVPAEIGQLKNLEILDLSHNALTGLPYELGNLAKLRVLDISGNAYSEADLSQIKKNLPAGVVIKTE
jgi:Leucine-rich repeat (LRR) protein